MDIQGLLKSEAKEGNLSRLLDTVGEVVGEDEGMSSAHSILISRGTEVLRWWPASEPKSVQGFLSAVGSTPVFRPDMNLQL